jgi:hypothetical protein
MDSWRIVVLGGGGVGKTTLIRHALISMGQVRCGFFTGALPIIITNFGFANFTLLLLEVRIYPVV